MNYKSFTAINTLECWTLNYDSILELLKDQEMVDKIREKELVHFHKWSMLAYYVNNVLSVDWWPTWIWSFACDVSYWISQEIGADYSDIVWYIIDELWYYDYVIDWELVDEIDNSWLTREKLFIHRLSYWFNFFWRKWELPRSRWINNL